MNLPPLHQRVTDRIKEQQLHPLPRWIFALRNDAFWTLWILSIALGGMALSLLILLAIEEEPDVLPLMLTSGSFRIFLILPLTWVLIATLMMLLAEFNLRHTERGYRITPLRAGFAGIALSILLAFLLHTAGWGQSFDILIRRNIPPYERMRMERMERWTRSEAGMLGGTIESVQGNTFLLRDFDGFLWNVIFDSFAEFHPALLQQGMPVRILGEWETERVFHAHGIRPW